jgi:hypothetical protein
MDKKVCTKCKKDKYLSDYGINKDRKHGYRSECKECRKEYRRKYRESNKDIISEKYKNYIDRVKENSGPLNNRVASSEEEKRKKRNEYQKKYVKNRKENDPAFKLQLSIRKLIYLTFKGHVKKSKTEEIIGIDFKLFKDFIELKFQEGMNWENYGKWHLDHIIPISSANSEQQIYELNHYTNFQPLWAEDNLKKSNKIER